MAGVKPPMPRIVPVFRFATALATFLFIITFVVNGLISLSAPTLASAPAPSAVGAMMAPLSAAQEAAPQAPAPPFVPIAPTETSAPRLTSAAPITTEVPMSSGAGLAPMTAETSTLERALKSNAPQVDHTQPENVQRNELSLPLDLEIFFGILALGFGVTAWILPRNNERSFRKKWKQK